VEVLKIITAVLLERQFVELDSFPVRGSPQGSFAKIIFLIGLASGSTERDPHVPRSRMQFGSKIQWYKQQSVVRRVAR